MASKKTCPVRGDGAAVRAYLDKNAEELTRIFRRIVQRWMRDGNAIDDLVQETFRRAIQSAGTFRVCDEGRFEARVRGWLFSILENGYRNHLRDHSYVPKTLRAGEESALDDMPDRLSAASTMCPKVMTEILEGRVSDDLTDKVNAALRSMPLCHRQTFVLFVLGGHSYEDISLMLRIPEGTVMSRVHRARSQLRRRLSGVTSRE